jgi:hypothetical protein
MRSDLPMSVRAASGTLRERRTRMRGLLPATELPLAQVAEESGVGDLSAFSGHVRAICAPLAQNRPKRQDDRVPRLVCSRYGAPNVIQRVEPFIWVRVRCAHRRMKTTRVWAN